MIQGEELRPEGKNMEQEGHQEGWGEDKQES